MVKKTKMQTIRLAELIPQPFYQGVYEMALLMNVQQYQLDALQEAIDKAQNNFFPIVADETGLAIFEKMLGITGTIGLDLETRRYNVIALLLPPRPITLRSFNELLQTLNINATLSVTGFHVEVRTETTDSQALLRLHSLMLLYLPANLTFKSFNYGQTSTAGATKHGVGGLLAGKVTSKKTNYAKGG